MMRSKGAWVEELLMVLWSYRTNSRSNTVETPFSLMYDTKLFLPLEILERSLHVTNFEEIENETEWLQDLDTLD